MKIFFARSYTPAPTVWVAAVVPCDARVTETVVPLVTSLHHHDLRVNLNQVPAGRRQPSRHRKRSIGRAHRGAEQIVEGPCNSSQYASVRVPALIDPCISQIGEGDPQHLHAAGRRSR